MKAVCALALLTAALWWTAGDPQRQEREHALEAPSGEHWLGTDELGRDQWSRFVVGGAWSLAIGAAATVVVLALASGVGGWAGYAGGWLDALWMGAGEVCLSVPWLYLVIAARAAFPPELPARAAALLLTGLIALVSWARPARLIRNIVLAESQAEYVAAALGFGQARWQAYARHVFPATRDTLLAQALILFPRFVLAELTLSFLGAGAGGAEPSWGTLLLPLRQVYLLPQQWWLALPAALMALFFLFTGVAASAKESAS